ncbi:MAG: hypothetical protein AAF577_06265 [Pseudomonadota bacterium]
MIPRDAAALGEFAFCKTTSEPCDHVVTACLARLAETGLIVSSDGEPEEWADGVAAWKKALGRPIAIPPLD